MSKGTAHITAPEDVVPLGQMLAFGAGGLSNQLFNAALAVFLAVLVVGIKMDPILAGVVAAAPRILDAITDPFMGFITDNTKSRWGRRKPFIFIGAIASGVFYALMWQLYPEDSEAVTFWYCLTMSFGFYISFTVLSVPLFALGYEMTPDYHERTKLMAVSQWIGQLAWVIAPTFWIIIMGNDFYPSADVGMRHFSMIVALFCTLLAILPALFCKEPPLPPGTELVDLSLSSIKANSKIFITAFFDTLKCGPFILLCVSTFLVYNGYMVITSFQYILNVHLMFGGDVEAAGYYPTLYGMIGALSTCFFVIPVVAYMAKKLGKKQTFVIAMSIAVIGYLLKWVGWNADYPWMQFLPLPLTSFGIGGLFTLMLSMTADVCALDRLQSGQQREGMFSAVYWWFVKVGFGLAALISGFVLSSAGFDGDLASQSAQTLAQLRIADAVIPAFTTLIAIFVMFKYDLDEERSHDIRRQIDERDKLATEKSTLTDDQPIPDPA
jgi:GPH family glycoside/pentoside/hexuronide:cation symporter